MQRIWNPIVKPLVNQVEFSTMLEVGAEGGAGTRALMRYLERRRGVLHSIDPAPGFDYEALQAEFPGRLVFHQSLSLEVIPELPRFQVGLIDGDHNWYTVHNELRQIEELHGADAAEFPLLFLHDVGWPYGRRDLYYDPSTIPEDCRQPYARQGILPGKSELDAGRGLNRQLCNATHMGGARNGVLTGIEDFVEQSALDFTLVVLPIYFGLAILVTKVRFESNAGLAKALADLQTVPGLTRLCELGERLRCVDNIFLQAMKRRLDSLEDDIETGRS